MVANEDLSAGLARLRPEGDRFSGHASRLHHANSEDGGTGEVLPVVQVRRLYDVLLTVVRQVSGEFGLLATNCFGMSTDASEAALGLHCPFLAHR